MNQPSRFVSSIMLLCVVQTVCLAGPKPLEVKWSEVAPLIRSHRVELTLRDGARIKGEAVVIREDSMLLDIKKVYGKSLFRKGSAAIHRDELSLIKVQTSRGSWGRSLGTVLGVLSGLTVGLYASIGDSASYSIPVFLAVASTMTLGGFFAGRALDRQETLIKIVP
jgi:hypothetical protein